MAKRVNKRFLTVLAVVVVVLAGGAFALSKFMTRGDAKEHLARGDAAFERYKQATDATQAFAELKAARDAYAKSLRIDYSNPDVIVKYGDIHHHLVRYDRTEISKDMRLWEEALQLNPNHVPALERLLESLIVYTELSPSPSVFTTLSERASALGRADPDNLRAKIYQHIGIVGAWLAGKAAPEATIDASLDELTELMKKKPDEAAIPSYVARAHLRMAHNQTVANDPDAAARRREQAQAVYAEAFKTQAENPHVLYDYYQVLAFFEAAERDAGARERRRTEMNEVLSKAARLAKPEDPDSVDILLTHARVLAQQGKAAEAEKAVLELNERRPNDQRVRLELARFWRMRPDKHRAAIELLAKPMGDDTSLAGFRALTMPGLEIKRLIDLTHLRVDAYADAGGGERSGLRQLIDESYQRAADLSSSESPEILKLRGRILLLDGNVKSTREAILAFQRAADKFEQNGYFDTDLSVLLARTYQSVNESGQARAILERVVERRPTYHTGRKMLLDLLVMEGQYKPMEKHVEALAAANPEDPDVARYRIILHATGDEPEKAKALVAALPQENDQQKLLKARLALLAKDPGTSIALLAPISAAELEGDGPFPASNFLAQVYLREKKQDEAKRIIGAVLAKQPDDKGWQLLAAYAEGRATPEELRKLNALAIDAIEDPLTRALQQYRVLIEQNKPAEGLAVLVEAERKLPDAGQVTELMFLHGIDFRQWDVADAAAAKLAKLDWDHAQGLYYRTRLRYARRDFAGALQGAWDLSRKLPEFSRTWVMLGQAQQANGQLEPAIASYQEALEKQPDSFEALRGTVDCYLALDRVAVARQYIDKGLQIGVGSAYFGDLLKRLEERRGDPLAVTAQREKDLEQNKDSLRAWTALSENYLRVADALMAKNDQKGSLEYVEKAKARLAEALERWPDEPQLYLQFADLVLRSGKVEEALAVADRLQAREKFRDRPEPFTLRAILLERTGPQGVRRAEEAMVQAVAKSGNSSDTQHALADFYARTGELDKAIFIKTELFAKSKDPVLREELIQHQLGAGRFKEAEKLIADALAADPSDTRLLAALGSVKARQGDFDGAQKVLGDAIKAGPQNAQARYYMGQLHRTRGDLGAAISELQRAADLRPTDVPTRLALSEAYQLRNQPEDAIRELELGLQAAPSEKTLREQLFRLYFAQHRWDPAERVLEQAKANESLARDPTWWQLESEMWAARGDARRTREAAEIAFKKAPANPDVLYQYLAVLLNQGDYQKIIAMTDPVAQPERSWWMHMVRGMARKGLNNDAESVAEFERALSAIDTIGDDAAADKLVRNMGQALGLPKVVEYLAARRDVRWKIILARTYQQNRDWTNAVKTMDELLTQDLPTLSDAQKLKALSVAGLLYHAAGAAVPGSLEKAERVYGEYIALLAKYNAGALAQVQALNNLALLLAEHPVSPDVSRALTYSKRAYDIMEGTNRFEAGVADTHGWVLVLADRVDEAIPLLRAAAAADPPLPDPFYHLGEAFIRKAAPDEAQNYLSRAQDLIKNYTDKGVFVDPSLAPKVEAAIAKVKTMPKAASAATP